MNDGKGRLTLVMILIIMCGYPLVDTIHELSTDLSLALKKPSYRNWHIAQELKHLGVKPDSKPLTCPTYPVLQPNSCQKVGGN